MESHYTYYSEYSIKSWISFLLNGEIKRPPYQRKFVWNLQKAYNLAKAVYDGNFVPPVVIAATQHDLGKKENDTYEIPKGIYLIDGQQRLSSLLLFSLGIWPKDYSNELEPENEGEDEIDCIETPLDELMTVYQSSNSSDKLVEKLLNSKKYVRLADVPKKTGQITTELKENVNKLLNRIQCNEKDIFLSKCLGYSYVRSNGDYETEKRLFASLFRDINSTGQPLLPSESRRAMYYLEPSLKALFEPALLKQYTIGSTNIDFPRYLAYVDELYGNFISSGSGIIASTCYIARGYSNNREDYILKYLTSAITLVTPKSKQFLKNMPTFESSFKGLFINKSFRDIPEFELWIFGLIFWSLFCGKEVNIARKEELETRFSQHKPNPYRKIGDIRARLDISVSAYQEVLKDTKRYVAFEVSEYLLQVKHIVPIKKSFSFQQVLDYVLPSVFMKMTGCLEHKLDMMSLHLAMNDEQWRQTTMRYNSKIPSSSEDITKIIEAIIAYISDNFDQNYSCEIWTDRKRLTESVQMTCKTLKEVGIADYLGAHYIVLENSAIDLPDKLTVKSNKGNPKNEAFVKVVYNQTIRFRNIYAHNEESVYNEFSSPCKLSSDMAKYNNWCFRFTTVTYVDLLIRNLFGDYTRFVEKGL